MQGIFVKLHSLNSKRTPYNDASLVAIGHKLWALDLKKNMPFLLYHGFHLRDFPENLYLALSTHALQMAHDWLGLIK
jgi:hypothetical protein